MDKEFNKRTMSEFVNVNRAKLEGDLHVGGDRGVPIFHYRLRQLSGLLEDQNQNLLGAILPAYCGRQDLGPLAAVETF